MPKPDGRVRLCGGFKVTVNQALNVDLYPLPTAQDLYATLAGGGGGGGGGEVHQVRLVTSLPSNGT